MNDASDVEREYAPRWVSRQLRREYPGWTLHAIQLTPEFARVCLKRTGAEHPTYRMTVLPCPPRRLASGLALTLLATLGIALYAALGWAIDQLARFGG